ncbi:cell division ATP-binding protein FtsE [Candidatus Parcubacteria bacterium]|nr:cell division ATP-binding protein FtsE [Candidatus Parcubacteria bacterium]
MILFEGVTKEYPDGTRALEDVDLHIKSGEFVFLVGPSGSGKTTVVKLMIREQLPTAGDIKIDDLEVLRLKRRELPRLRRKVGIVFQEFRLLPARTAFENVAVALGVVGKTRSEIEAIVPNVLQMVGLGERSHLFPYQLSGGEKQKLAIARALSHEPEILVADEPTGMIDPASTWEVVELLKKINSWGTTVLVATHDAEVVNSLEKRVVRLEKGRVVTDKKKGSYGR